MPHELTMLGWSVALGLVYVGVGGALSTAQRGLKWNAGNREAPVPPLTGAAFRASRSVANFLETFPFFAATLLAVVVAGRLSPRTALGADLYFWARLAYLPTYVIGIPYLRTLIWLVSIIGLLMELTALLG